MGPVAVLGAVVGGAMSLVRGAILVLVTMLAGVPLIAQVDLSGLWAKKNADAPSVESRIGAPETW